MGVAGMIVFTALSMQQQMKAASEQRKAQKAQRRIAEAKNRRERRNQVRQVLAAQAQQRAQAVATGQSSTGLASGTLGNIFSAGTQGAQNVGFINEVEDLGGVASRANQRASRASTNASIFKSAAGISGQVSMPSSTQTPAQSSSSGTLFDNRTANQ